MGAPGALQALWCITYEMNMNNTTDGVPVLQVQMPNELDGRHLEILKTSPALDVWSHHPGETVDSGPIALPSDASGATLVVAAGRWATIAIEGSQDGGKSWERLAVRPSMLGNVVATYAHQATYLGTAGVRLTHLRVKASRAGKGAVKVGLEVVWL